MLPIFFTNNKDLQLLQNSWAKQLNPVLGLSQLDGVMLENISLSIGANTINHLLSRQMIGWYLTDQNAPASIYRSQALNSKTLTLTSDAAVTVNIWAF